ncbi:MAG: ribosome recycling factor [Puniceicoccales bacterium]|jgi:ribosome recycling factor|nr:ribosome recycling factor [Puniceicoccales bacterium]
MTQEKTVQETKQKMQKAVQFTASEFATIHAGKASAAMVEGIMVEAYGAKSILRNMASITTPDSRVIVIEPWDKGAMKAVEKAIIVANLGFMPVTDSGRIRCTIPEMSMERRQEMAKRAASVAENGKVSVRNVRHESMAFFKAEQKAGRISEDDLKSLEKEVQKVTDASIQDVNELLAKKEKELLTR